MQINSKDISYPDNLEINENLEEFVLQQQIYRAAIKEIKTKLEILDEEFQVKYDHNPIHHMEYRLKAPKSIAEKMKKKGLELNADSIRKNLTDIAGVRVICNYLDDINRITNLLLRQDDISLVRKRDYISNPKENGYRSLHLIVLVPVFLAERTESVPVEIQIRTIAMDFWASLEHQLKYKSHSEISEELRERLKSCAESITHLDMEMQTIYKKIKSEICLFE
ncbi:GTP pyrophosphokinase [Acetobacterium tundrae]|uniref:GTP pyrophosphokinase family protein n=1 Tax=Acetobacterium tundrae TaxID=132932 RepID=A0ABR6WJP7_9FIRM|nr:GTP pyrophosphokinase family protein [Acetobacterium tundrae]MBC3796362.1 GTP pyrophosphokinase family protein [Acetobacterium tundrae]